MGALGHQCPHNGPHQQGHGLTQLIRDGHQGIRTIEDDQRRWQLETRQLRQIEVLRAFQMLKKHQIIELFGDSSPSPGHTLKKWSRITLKIVFAESLPKSLNNPAF